MIYSFLAGSDVAAIFRHHTLCTSGSASTVYILWGWYKLHPLVMFAVSTRGTSRQVHKWMIRLRHALVHSGSAWESIEPRVGVQVLYVTELSGSWTLKSTRGGVQVLMGWLNWVSRHASAEPVAAGQHIAMLDFSRHAWASRFWEWLNLRPARCLLLDFDSGLYGLA